MLNFSPIYTKQDYNSRVLENNVADLDSLYYTMWIPIYRYLKYLTSQCRSGPTGKIVRKISIR